MMCPLIQATIVKKSRRRSIFRRSKRCKINEHRLNSQIIHRLHHGSTLMSNRRSRRGNISRKSKRSNTRPFILIKWAKLLRRAAPTVANPPQTSTAKWKWKYNYKVDEWLRSSSKTPSTIMVESVKLPSKPVTPTKRSPVEHKLAKIETATYSLESERAIHWLVHHLKQMLPRARRQRIFSRYRRSRWRRRLTRVWLSSGTRCQAKRSKRPRSRGPGAGSRTCPKDHASHKLVMVPLYFHKFSMVMQPSKQRKQWIIEFSMTRGHRAPNRVSREEELRDRGKPGRPRQSAPDQAVKRAPQAASAHLTWLVAVAPAVAAKTGGEWKWWWCGMQDKGRTLGQAKVASERRRRLISNIELYR